jgi:glycosyltransferase involved in cell wall biosynthesis
MNVLVTASARFVITSDGNLWTPNASLGYRFWTRYLDVYNEVHLLVRAKPQPVPPRGWNMASGPGIKAVPLPYYEGPWAFVKNYVSIKRAIGKALSNAEAIQLRIPCTIGGEVWRALPSQRPYGVEVVTDPYNVFAPGSVRHPLRPFFRWWFARQLRRQCAGACAAAYVTEHALQRRYPPGPSAYTTHYSSIELPDAAFVSVPRSPRPEARTFNLIIVGTLAQLHKAPDVLIDAVGACVEEGLDLQLVSVGDGKSRPELEAQTAALGLGGRVRFLGQLPAGEAVRAQLDQADLFVLPSKAEGLPKALIEAMARGLPCIGSTVGGIPELLSPEDMVPPGDVTALARKIREVVTDPARMARMSARNLDKAKEYREPVLCERWIAFYRYVQERTEAWLETKGR